MPIEIMDGCYEIANMTPMPWDLFEPDVLIVLLVHCDDRDAIPAECCAPLADRLQLLLDRVIAKSEGQAED